MKGYDIFFENPREIKERICQVCGSLCEVERDRIGATGWIEALGKHTHVHDFFRCPHSGKDWHARALKIVLAIEETPSKRVAGLMQQDLIDLLAENNIQSNLLTQT